MLTAIAVWVLVLVVNGAILAGLSGRLAGHAHSVAPGETSEEFPVERYRPMFRMLRNDDILFLRQQPGYTRSLEWRLRTQRRRLFLRYLNTLRADFDGVCAALEALMVDSATDRPDLASALLRARAGFGWWIFVVRVRVAIYSLGVGSVDASGLLRAFDSVRRELQARSPQTAAI